MGKKCAYFISSCRRPLLFDYLIARNVTESASLRPIAEDVLSVFNLLESEFYI